MKTLHTAGPIRARVDWSKADVLLDSYKAKLTDPKLLPQQYGQAWTRVEMEKLGMVDNRSSLSLSEFFAVWYACLIFTGRVHEFARLERKTVSRAKHKRTSQQTINACLKRGTTTFNTDAARLLRELIDWHKSTAQAGGE